MYIYALVGFGRREFYFTGIGGRRYHAILSKGEFLCSITGLAKLSGRGREKISELLRTVSSYSRETEEGNRLIYTIRYNISEHINSENQSILNRTGISSKSAETKGITRAYESPKTRHQERKPFLEKEREKAPVTTNVVSGNLGDLIKNTCPASPDKRKNENKTEVTADDSQPSPTKEEVAEENKATAAKKRQGKIQTLLKASSLYPKNREKIMRDYNITEDDLERARREQK